MRGSRLTKEISKAAFGWNANTWSRPFFWALDRVESTIGLENLRVLEIGSSERSSIALALDNGCNDIVITNDEEITCRGIDQKIDKLKSSGAVSEKVSVKQMSIFDIAGQFDLIVMKSVLGGLFRSGDKSASDIRRLLQDIGGKHLSEQGFLITCDNGYSFLDGALSRFGARRRGWSLLKPGEIADKEDQIAYGFISCFSLANRFGGAGAFVEDRILSPIDYFFHMVGLRYRPTVITTVLPASRFRDSQFID